MTPEIKVALFVGGALAVTLIAARFRPHHQRHPDGRGTKPSTAKPKPARF